MAQLTCWGCAEEGDLATIPEDLTTVKNLPDGIYPGDKICPTCCEDLDIQF